MWTLLRQPRWIAASVVVAVIAGVFVSLGLWQLDRHAERGLENAVRSERLSATPVELADALASVGAEVDSLEYRPVRVDGTFRPEAEVLVRSQVADERPGFHVVTPLDTALGTVLVNRGWVPLAVERPPVMAVPPPTGSVVVVGVVRLSQQRPAIGPTEPDGRLEVISRIDLERLERQYDDLAPVWVQQTDPAQGALPERVPLPDVSDPGPHLPYAVQWFSFAAIAAGGFLILARRAVR